MKRFFCLITIVALQLLIVCGLVVYVSGTGTLFPHTAYDSLIIPGVILGLLGMGLNALIALVRCLFLPQTTRFLWIIILVVEGAMMVVGLFASAIAHQQFIFFVAVSLGVGCLLSAVAGFITTFTAHQE